MTFLILFFIIASLVAADAEAAQCDPTLMTCHPPRVSKVVEKGERNRAVGEYDRGCTRLSSLGCRSGAWRTLGKNKDDCSRMSSLGCRSGAWTGARAGKNDDDCSRMSSLRCGSGTWTGGRTLGKTNDDCARMSSLRCRPSATAWRAAVDQGGPDDRHQAIRRDLFKRTPVPGNHPKRVAGSARPGSGDPALDQAIQPAVLSPLDVVGRTPVPGNHPKRVAGSARPGSGDPALDQAIQPAVLSPLDVVGGWGIRLVSGVARTVIRTGAKKCIVGTCLLVSVGTSAATKISRGKAPPLPAQFLRDRLRRDAINRSATIEAFPRSLLHGRRPDPVLQLRIGGRK